MSETQTSNIENQRPQPSPEQIRNAVLLYKTLTKLAAEKGEPVVVGLSNGRLTQSTKRNIESGFSADKDFIEEGQYLGERTAQYDAATGEQDVRVVATNEQGTKKTGLLAELDLDESDEARHNFLLYPDMNISHTVTRFEWDHSVGEDENPLIGFWEEDRGWLQASETQALQLLVETIHDR